MAGVSPPAGTGGSDMGMTTSGKLKAEASREAGFLAGTAGTCGGKCANYAGTADANSNHHHTTPDARTIAGVYTLPLT